MNRLTVTGTKFLTPIQASKEQLLEEIKRHQKYYDRLAAYEDTGLEPEEVKQLNASDASKEESSIKYYNEMRKYRDELKYYKKLEEQGRLIKLPCKVGQSLYVYNYTMGGIREFIARDKTWIFENMMSFGKEIFLTREEAEKALKESEEK